MFFRLWRCRRLPYRGDAIARCRCHCFLTLDPFASDFAARPGKIIGAAGGRRQRFALDQRASGERIDRGWARSRPAEQLIGADGGGDQRQDWSGEGPRRGLTGRYIGIGRRRLGRQCDRRRTRGEQPRDFALDIVCELACARFGEIHAIVRAQLASGRQWLEQN